MSRGKSKPKRSPNHSARPANMPIGSSKIKLKINLPRASGHKTQGASDLPSFALAPVGAGKVDEEPEENEDFPDPQLGARKSRSGRNIKQPKHEDYAYGSEAFISSSDAEMHSEEDDVAYQGAVGYSPILLQKQQSARKTSDRPSKSKPTATQLSLPQEFKVGWPDYPSTYPLAYDLPAPDDAVAKKIDEIIGKLGIGPRMFVTLPNAGPKGSPDEAYTPELLMGLYLRAHEENRWHICDLVADTWIRAFHAKRLRQEEINKFDDMCWRFNEPLYNRRKQGIQCFGPNTSNWNNVLGKEDPLLADDVLDFHPELLGRLYTHTKGHCPARDLWADTMALCGRKLEDRMQKDQREGIRWNERLMYDIMCSALRLVGRKLTLKVEEAGEGVWCKRYHTHTLHGQPCYRKAAYDRKLAGLDLSDEEMEEEGPMTQVMSTSLDTSGGQFTAGLDGGNFLMNEGTEEDAEGDSDDEYA